MQSKKILLSLMLLSLVIAIGYHFAKQDPYYYEGQKETNMDKPPLARIEALEKIEDLPELQFIDKDGSLKSIYNFKDRVLVVNFWASWCLPCIKELPKLNNLKLQYQNQLDVIAISIDSNDFAEVKDFFDGFNLQSLNFYIDHNNLSYIASRALGVPTTLIIDKNFKIHYRISGFVDWEEKENQAMLTKLLKQS